MLFLISTQIKRRFANLYQWITQIAKYQYLPSLLINQQKQQQQWLIVLWRRGDQHSVLFGVPTTQSAQYNTIHMAIWSGIHVHHLISLGRRGVNVVIVWVRDRVKSARKITSCETYTDLTWLDSIHSPSHTIQLYQPPSLLLRGSVGWVCSATGISIYRYPLTRVVVDPPIANCSSAASARLTGWLPLTTSNQPPTHGLMMVIKWIVNAICSDQAKPSQPAKWND